MTVIILPRTSGFEMWPTISSKGIFLKWLTQSSGRFSTRFLTATPLILPKYIARMFSLLPYDGAACETYVLVCVCVRSRSKKTYNMEYISGFLETFNLGTPKFELLRFQVNPFIISLFTRTHTLIKHNCRYGYLPPSEIMNQCKVFLDS